MCGASEVTARLRGNLRDVGGDGHMSHRGCPHREHRPLRAQERSPRLLWEDALQRRVAEHTELSLRREDGQAERGDRGHGGSTCRGPEVERREVNACGEQKAVDDGGGETPAQEQKPCQDLGPWRLLHTARQSHAGDGDEP